MIAAVVGLGKTALDWGDNQRDFSIGCNDSGLFGFHLTHLLIIDSMKRFGARRIDTIKETCADKVWLFGDSWRHVFPDANRIPQLLQFHKVYKHGKLYSSKSSPFVAVTLAASLGAKDIVMYGCDYNDHSNLIGKIRDYEIRQFGKLYEAMKKEGINMWVSSKESALSQVIPVK